MKIASREDAIEFRKLRDHIGVMWASENLKPDERAHLYKILASMFYTLKKNGYLCNIGRADSESLDIGEGGGGWEGYL